MENPVEALPKSQRELYSKLPDACSTRYAAKVAVSMGISERTAKRLVFNPQLFARMPDGTYGKLSAEPAKTQ